MEPLTNDPSAKLGPAIDDAQASAEALREKLADAQTPGYQAELDPDEADTAGAFMEDALSEEDSLASTDDVADLTGDGALEPAFLDDDGPSAVIPSIFTTANVRKLFDLRPGESVAQAAARKAKENSQETPDN